MASDRFVDLELDRTQLDSNFDGYKLSLESLPVYDTGFGSGIDTANLTGGQYSFQHVKAFGAPNQLYLDPWHQETVYIIDDKWNVQQIAFTSENQFVGPTAVFQIPDGATQRCVRGRVTGSLQFPCDNLVVIADGAGKLYLIDTGARRDNGEWKTAYADYVLGSDKVFTVVHASRHSDNESESLECILLHVEQTCDDQCEEESQGSEFTTKLEWLTFTSDGKEQWCLDRSRRLVGGSSPDYITVDHTGAALFLSSGKPFKFEYDSVPPVEDEDLSPEAAPESHHPAYTWYQTEEDAELQFTLPVHTNRSDILFKLTQSHLSLALKNGPTLLEGDLGGRVDVETSTWTIGPNNRLELTLTKLSSDNWDTVVCGDSSGEMVLNPQQAAAIHERLAQYTTDNMDADPQENMNPPYNSQQLEECDAFPEETATLTRWDGESHKITHKVNMSSHQILFTCLPSAGEMPVLCLRHDVDGVVWQPAEDVDRSSAPWRHTATFNALGYVQASKQQRKFATCTPDYSLAVLSDNMRHLYLYRQPAAISSPIRNRKTGRHVAAVAKQHLVTLESVDTILGLRAAADKVFVLAGSKLFVVRTGQEDVP